MKLEGLKPCKVFIDKNWSGYPPLRNVFREQWNEILKESEWLDDSGEKFYVYGKLVKIGTSKALVLLGDTILYDTPVRNVCLLD